MLQKELKNDKKTKSLTFYNFSVEIFLFIV